MAICNFCQNIKMHYTDEVAHRLAMLTALCQVNADVTALVASIGTSAVAAFSPLSSMTVAVLGAAHALLKNLPDGTKVVILDNRTNGEVIVSMDGGTSDHYNLGAGQTLTLPLGESGLITTANIHIRNGVATPTVGTVYAYSYG